MLRVLQVFGRMDRGGAETMLMNMYRQMDRQRVQLDFVEHTEDSCAFDGEITALGGRIYRCPRYTGANHLRYVRWWRDFFAAHPEYRVVHCHVRSTASLILAQAAGAGVFTIAHSHSISSGSGLAAAAKDALQRGIRGHADAYMACSLPAGEWLFGGEITSSDRFTLLKNGIQLSDYGYDAEKRRLSRERLGAGERTVIGHVGRFDRAKNQEYALRVFRRYHVAAPKSMLLLVGDGELRESMEHLSRELGIEDSVRFTGVRSDVPELMRAMDLFVFPSIFEGLPVSLIEAQASGLPCLVSGGVPRSCDVTGLVEFMELSDGEEKWAQKLLTMTGAPRTDRCSDVAAAGYDAEQNARRLEDFYCNAGKQ